MHLLCHKNFIIMKLAKLNLTQVVVTLETIIDSYGDLAHNLGYSLWIRDSSGTAHGEELAYSWSFHGDIMVLTWLYCGLSPLSRSFVVNLWCKDMVSFVMNHG